jgi:hypothetical protein
MRFVILVSVGFEGDHVDTPMYSNDSTSMIIIIELH